MVSLIRWSEVKIKFVLTERLNIFKESEKKNWVNKLLLDSGEMIKLLDFWKSENYEFVCYADDVIRENFLPFFRIY